MDAAFHISCGCMFWLLKNKQDAALFISERGARLASFAYLHSPAVHVLMSDVSPRFCALIRSHAAATFLGAWA
jgi:hypothetical protein